MVLILGVVALLGFAAPARAAGDSPLSVAQTSVSMQVVRNGLFATRATSNQATGSLLVSNTGATDLSGVKITAYYSDGVKIADTNFWYGSPGATRDSAVSAFGVSANGSVPISLHFTWTMMNMAAGWLVVTDTTGHNGPVTVPFQVEEVVPGAVLRAVAEWAGLVAVIVVVIVALTLRLQRKPRKITEGPTWSFHDSWATNLTALGAVLATILAASGFLSDVLPGVSTGTFLGFSLLYGLLILIAPVVFQALSLWSGEPNYWGLLVAGGIVLWATMGELATAVILVNQGWLPGWGVWTIFVAGAAALACYVRASILPVIAPAPPATVDVGAAATSAAATAAAMATAFDVSVNGSIAVQPHWPLTDRCTRHHPFSGRVTTQDPTAAAMSASRAVFDAAAAEDLAERIGKEATAAALQAKKDGKSSEAAAELAAREVIDAAKSNGPAAWTKMTVDELAELSSRPAAAAAAAVRAGKTRGEVTAASESEAWIVIEEATASRSAPLFVGGPVARRARRSAVRPAAMW